MIQLTSLQAENVINEEIQFEPTLESEIDQKNISVFIDTNVNTLKYEELQELWWVPVNLSVLTESVKTCLLNTEKRYSTAWLADVSASNWTAVLEWACATLLMERPYLLPWWKQLSWTMAFSLMIAAAVIGNTIVLWIVRGMIYFRNFFI